MNKNIWKRRLMLVACAAVITVSAAGCGGREGGQSSVPSDASQASTPTTTAPTEAPLNTFTLYQDAVAKMLAAKNYDATASFVIKEEGLDISTTQKVTISTVMTNKDNLLQSLSDTSISVLGQKVNQSEYYDGTYRYYSSAGANFKQKCNKDSYLEKNTGISSADFLTFDEKAMRDAVAEEKDGSVVVLSATVASDKVSDQLSEMLGGMDQTLSALGEMLFTDPQFTMTLDKDGYIKDYSLSIGASIPLDITESDSSSEMQITVDFSMTLNKIGDDITITPPTGLDAYQELPESPLSIEEILQITSSLFDEQGNPVAEFNEIYAYYQQQYGEDVIDNLFES